MQDAEQTKIRNGRPPEVPTREQMHLRVKPVTRQRLMEIAADKNMTLGETMDGLVEAYLRRLARKAAVLVPETKKSTTSGS